MSGYSGQKVDERCTGKDGKQIKQVGRPDAKAQGKAMEDRLGTWGIGGDIKHICPPVPGSQDIDGGGHAANHKETGNGVRKTTPASVGTATAPDQQAYQDEKAVPKVSVERQGPVDMAEAVRDS